MRLTLQMSLAAIASRLDLVVRFKTKRKDMGMTADQLSAAMLQFKIDKRMANVRYLPITTCYQCHIRDSMACLCKAVEPNRCHPPREKGIPKWCPLGTESNAPRQVSTRSGDNLDAEVRP
jgi:hypothetical protein